MEKSRKNRKTISTIISVTIGFIVYFLVKQFVFTPQSIDKAMMKAASELNESCPIMVDQDTRLDNAVTLTDNIFQYNYTLVNLVKDSIDLKAFKDSMKPLILNNVKTNPDLKFYRDNKITMAYYYKDMNGEFVSKILISPDQYLEIE